MKTDFVYLASASPRRSELLRQIGVPFRVRPAAIPEEQVPGEAPDAYVLRLAAAKAAAVWSALERGEDAARARGRYRRRARRQVLGKPADAAEAEAMLAALSGRAHRVLTAIALKTSAGADTLLCESEVRFRATTPAERRAYCATGEPFDKAGGYGIQGHAAVFVEHLRGSYSERRGPAAVRDRRAAGSPRHLRSGSRQWPPHEARRNPDQRHGERGPRRARRERRAAGSADRAREPARRDQQHLQGQGVARAARHAGRVHRARPRAHGVPARVRHRAQPARGAARATAASPTSASSCARARSCSCRC